MDSVHDDYASRRYRGAAEIGNVQAMIRLAQKYDFRWTSDPNHKQRALEWYKRAAAAICSPPMFSACDI
jgi:TPR repeat protein